MPLIFRPTQPKDFPQCLEITHDRFLYKTEKSQAELLDFWRKILAGRLAMSSVVEDEEKQKGKNIVGFGMIFFATDEFAREARTTLPPFYPNRSSNAGKRGANTSHSWAKKKSAITTPMGV